MRRVCIGAGATCAAIIVALGFWPALIGDAWHLMHGGYTTYEGLKIEVPKGWFVYHSEGNLLILRLRAQFLGRYASSAGISLYPVFPKTNPFHHESDWRRLSAIWLTEARNNGYTPMAETQLPTGTTLGYCLESSRTGREREVMIKCAVEGGTVVVSYEGDKRYVTQFNSLLQQMSSLRIAGQ